MAYPLSKIKLSRQELKVFLLKEELGDRTLRQIGEELGVTRQSIHLHFITMTGRKWRPQRKERRRLQRENERLKRREKILTEVRERARKRYFRLYQLKRYYKRKREAEAREGTMNDVRKMIRKHGRTAIQDCLNVEDEERLEA